MIFQAFEEGLWINPDQGNYQRYTMSAQYKSLCSRAINIAASISQDTIQANAENIQIFVPDIGFAKSAKSCEIIEFGDEIRYLAILSQPGRNSKIIIDICSEKKSVEQAVKKTAENLTVEEKINSFLEYML